MGIGFVQQLSNHLIIGQRAGNLRQQANMCRVLIFQTHGKKNNAANLATVQRFPWNILTGASNRERGLFYGGGFSVGIAIWFSKPVDPSASRNQTS